MSKYLFFFLLAFSPLSFAAKINLDDPNYPVAPPAIEDPISARELRGSGTNAEGRAPCLGTFCREARKSRDPKGQATPRAEDSQSSNPPQGNQPGGFQPPPAQKATE